MPSSLLDEKLLYVVPRRDIVIDSGILLVHAMGAFEGGRYLPLACGFLKEKDRTKVSRELFTLIDRLVVTMRSVVITPHVLTEFFALIRSRMRLRGRKLSDLIGIYGDVLLRLSEEPIPKDKLLSSRELLRLGISDASTIMAANIRDAMIITADYGLVQWCRTNGLPALHVYYDVYLLL